MLYVRSAISFVLRYFDRSDRQLFSTNPMECPVPPPGVEPAPPARLCAHPHLSATRVREGGYACECLRPRAAPPIAMGEIPCRCVCVKVHCLILMYRRRGAMVKTALFPKCLLTFPRMLGCAMCLVPGDRSVGTVPRTFAAPDDAWS